MHLSDRPLFRSAYRDLLSSKIFKGRSSAIRLLQDSGLTIMSLLSFSTIPLMHWSSTPLWNLLRDELARFFCCRLVSGIKKKNVSLKRAKLCGMKDVVFVLTEPIAVIYADFPFRSLQKFRVFWTLRFFFLEKFLERSKNWFRNSFIPFFCCIFFAF